MIKEKKKIFVCFSHSPFDLSLYFNSDCSCYGFGKSWSLYQSAKNLNPFSAAFAIFFNYMSSNSTNFYLLAQNKTRS